MIETKLDYKAVIRRFDHKIYSLVKSILENFRYKMTDDVCQSLKIKYRNVIVLNIDCQ